MEDINLSDSKYYRNREISWLQFNERVIEEAVDDTNPLFEKIKFLGISASNLDEFTVVRVASLKDMVHAGYTGNDIAGMNPTVSLSMVSLEAHRIFNRQYEVYNNEILCQLKDVGIEILNHNCELNSTESKYVDSFFESDIFPVITPIVVDKFRPFPLIKNEVVTVCVLLEDRLNPEHSEFVIISMPEKQDRLIEMPQDSLDVIPDKVVRRFITIEDVVLRNLNKILPGRKVIASSIFRIMRNADLSIDEEDAEDLLLKIEEQVKKREWGEIIRLDATRGMDGRILNKLSEAFKVSTKDIFFTDGPVDLTFLNQIYNLKGYDALKESKFEPKVSCWLKDGNIFDKIREADRLVFTPFESYEPVVEFVKSACEDKDVLAIKQTLYRVGKKSPIVRSLIDAAKSGKEVTVLVELKARFDEKENIEWARLLEQSGAHVIYGFPGLKTHAKITLVVRKEKDAVRRYVHLSTGNYNTITAGRYTDINLFTADEAFGSDAVNFFNMLGGQQFFNEWKAFVPAPVLLKDTFLKLINNEIENAKMGLPSGILAKLNSLCDPDVIRALYRASAAGVKVDLIVRGICCLKVGIAKVSDNITVKSIVGRFLEHSRVYRFENGGECLMFCSSADWMPRNLERRVEIMFPIYDEHLKEKLNLYLTDLLNDNTKGRNLHKDGRYFVDNKDLYPYNYQLDYMTRSNVENG